MVSLESHWHRYSITITPIDQGWTTEDTEGTYQTSSWFEVSILRPKQPNGVMGVEDDAPSSPFYPDACSYGSVHQNVQEAVQAIYPSDEMQLVPRTSLATEPQRLHCDEMINATASDHDAKKPRSRKRVSTHGFFKEMRWQGDYPSLMVKWCVATMSFGAARQRQDGSETEEVGKARVLSMLCRKAIVSSYGQGQRQATHEKWVENIRGVH
jgi:hypothetical protein